MSIDKNEVMNIIFFGLPLEIWYSDMDYLLEDFRKKASGLRDARWAKNIPTIQRTATVKLSFVQRK